MSEAESVLSAVVPEAPVPTTAPEAAPPVVEAPKADPMSPRLAALMRKEADAVRKLREATTKEQQLKAREEALAAETAKNAEFRRLLKENPLKALESEGVNYDILTKIQLENGNVPPEHHINQLNKKIEQLEQRLADRDKREEEFSKNRAREELESTTSNYKMQLGDFVKTNKEKFPLTDIYNRADLVYSVIESHHERTKDPETGAGEIMEPGKAAEMVETYLLREAQKARDILSKAEQATSPATTTAPKPPGSSRFQLEPQNRWVERSLKTLSNDLPAGTPASRPAHFLSDEEREANALAKLRAIKAAKVGRPTV